MSFLNQEPFTIREATLEDATAIAGIHTASWQDTYQHILSQDFLSKISKSKRAEMWKKILNEYISRREIVYSAWLDTEMVGYAHGGPSRSSIEGWVLAKNPSMSFYEKLGGRRGPPQTIKIDNDQHEEWSYVFELGAPVTKSPAEKS